MAETQTPTVAENRVATQDLRNVRDWLTGEPIGLRTPKAFRVKSLKHSWATPQVVFIVWDDMSLSRIMESPAMEVRRLVMGAQNIGEQVLLEDLPATQISKRHSDVLIWMGYATLEGDELTQAIAHANETYCDKGVWSGSPEGQMMEAHWPTKVQEAVARLRAAGWTTEANL
jgi:hypothetical protein